MERLKEYRGIDIKTNQFVYGDLIQTPENYCRIIGFVDKSFDGVHDYDDFNVRVINESVCEFTGCFDKNKNKIYENDILEFDDGSQIKIEFKFGSFGYMANNYFITLAETNLLLIQHVNI